jgi:hypothetical protein
VSCGNNKVIPCHAAELSHGNIIKPPPYPSWGFLFAYGNYFLVIFNNFKFPCGNKEIKIR